MKKILYLMHVHWGWIKQRPHFIAEYLSNYYDVDVFYEKSYRKKRLLQNKIPITLRVKELFKLPFGRYSCITNLNSIITKFQLRKIIKEYDLIWFTYPNMFKTIEEILPERAKVIYDCMDNILELPSIKSKPNLRETIFSTEEKLIKRSDVVFTSSDYLKQNLIKRYKTKKEIFVVNNAISLDNKMDTSYNLNSKLLLHIENKFKKAKFKLTYIGTISEWIDMELILESLEKFKDITYMFFGPSEVNLPKYNRILYFGPIEHKYIFNVMKESDALIMPFKINELILSVNPAKLYEYVYSCKPCIAVEYAETLRFKDYIYLYKSKDEYFDILRNLANSNLPIKKSHKDCEKFVESNSWEKRVENVVNIIEDKSKDSR